MKNTQQIVNIVIKPCKPRLLKGLALMVVALALGACGQRGSLYLPQIPAGSQRTSMVEALTATPENAKSTKAEAKVDASPAKPTLDKK